jgi:phosphatidylserine/phosphatidylglycerophosphate/cardiolipin synthase-like enzyme
VQRITAPDSSLNGLLGMINSATSTLDIEQMTFDPAWGNPDLRSPLLDAVVAAARRGVQVRVLLNDESAFHDDPAHAPKPKNPVTVDYLNGIARSEGLRLYARIANVQAMGVDYIHNKGMLADGTQSLISSINWDENAVERNREAAVKISGPAVYSYYEALFQHDWDVSQ